MIVMASDEKIDPTSLTSIGDLTGGGDLAASFDGSFVTAQASCSTKSGTSGYIGKTFSKLRTLTRAVVFGSSDAGYVSSADPTITLTVYGKAGTSAPSTSTDGTSLGSLTPFTDTADESTTARSITGLTAVPANYGWVKVDQSGGSATMGTAQVLLFAAWTPVLASSAYTLDNPIICANSIATTITATTEETANPATNLSNPSTSLKWRATDTATVYITVTNSSVYDYFCVARHNFYSTGATLTLQARTSTNTFVDIITDFTVSNDGPLILRFPEQDAGDVRLKIASATDQPEAAVVTAGSTLVIQRRLYVGHEPITMARQVNSVAASSESGEFLGRIILGQYSESEIALQNLTADFVRDSLDPFIQDALNNPYFFAWRPNTYPLETALCWIPPGSSPRPQNQLSNGMMQISIPVMGITT